MRAGKGQKRKRGGVFGDKTKKKTQWKQKMERVWKRKCEEQTERAFSMKTGLGVM